MVRHTPRHLTLGDLRRYVQESSAGTLQLSGGAADWTAPLGPATNDSRTIAPGGLFVALRGEHTDGHGYIPEALARGATALIVAHVPAGNLGRSPVFWLVPDPLHALQDLAAWWRPQLTRSYQ